MLNSLCSKGARVYHLAFSCKVLTFAYAGNVELLMRYKQYTSEASEASEASVIITILNNNNKILNPLNQ